jgi:predicted transcriptional regulator of viral defense system
MNSRDAYARLRNLGVPVVETAEAAALLGQSVYAASKTLARLASSGLVTRVRSGTWCIDDSLSPLGLAQYLAAPYASYASLYTALRVREMVQQVPGVTYLVTLGRSRRLRTRRGTFSLHHIAPGLFGGFEHIDGTPVATPEKALFDIAYLAGGRSRLRAGVPELELPKNFRYRELARWLSRIPSPRGRSMVSARLSKMLGSAKSHRRALRRYSAAVRWRPQRRRTE